MRVRVAFSIVAFAIGIISYAFAGPTIPSVPASSNGLALPGGMPSGVSGAAPTATPSESNTYEQDEALYRGKTSESENSMLRDEGALHFKPRPKEKIQAVDSLKNLQTTGSDPKFQSSLLNSDINALAKMREKTNEARPAADQADPRFSTKQLSFAPQKDNEPVKAKADSSPSPTASPSASPTKKDSSAAKQ